MSGALRRAPPYHFYSEKYITIQILEKNFT